MKFTSVLFTLGLATSVFANPTKVVREPSLVERDVAAVTSVLADIETKVKALDSAINSYSGGDPSKVESASSDLVSTINSGTSTVTGSDDLSSTDALEIPGPVQDLTKDVQTAVNDLISKKDQFVSAGAGATVYQQLQKQYTAAKNLADALTSKVPDSLSSLASSLSAGITDAIQKGVDEYKDVATSSGTASSATSAASSASDKTATSAASSATEKSETTAAAATTSDSATTGAQTSSPVIPTSASASATPSSSSTPSASASSTLFTGAANSDRFNYVFGGAAAAAAAIAVAL
ncbi:hypothetical protein BO82DRAFT_164960 [Aspergillus uvarum CBS 121591]|uniref:Cell wall mannoprotein 1 n=1 Tax=Aspergillus uvarum CBS 121591 TaxID=1448315 RepID=A0A319E3J3_9EURO|nr:hypothetical protein BO82DRAFT_164960 [Aspergillus uvarum CBS 121591]PYH85642.1 hypothetical protein BO82DRAFT_164960 [Aspergillus uvarum CBS 121591]